MTEDERNEIAKIIAGAQAASLMQSCAIAGALAEADVLDPRNVAKWATYLASIFRNENPEVESSVREQLEIFASVVQTPPKPAGRA